MNDLIIGLTMRITAAVSYNELRHTIADDWIKYLCRVFPDANYVLLPNSPETIKTYIRKLGINALILTGGDDIGIYPLRDKTERVLIEESIKNDIPLIGICRGMQVIQDYLGGTIAKGDNDFMRYHVATHHEIEWQNNLRLTVNSYHSNYIPIINTAHRVEVLAVCKEDMTIEAMKYKTLLGMMWHPERDNPNPFFDEYIFNYFYREEA